MLWLPSCRVSIQVMTCGIETWISQVRAAGVGGEADSPKQHMAEQQLDASEGSVVSKNDMGHCSLVPRVHN